MTIGRLALFQGLVITSTDDSRFGVGFAVPNDFEDGSFANKVPTSDDKLLKQLLGEKAAKAHLDARKAKAIVTKPPKQTPRKLHPPQRKDESEDEEEGRASAFKSKKQKTEKKPAKSRGHESESDGSAAQDAPIKDDLAKNTRAQTSDDHIDEDTKTETPKSKQPPVKPVSFLDQILAERSKKKKKKAKS
jgi:hypothetical protein